MNALPMMAALYGLAFFNIFLRSTMGILAPELAVELALSPGMLGIVASSFFISYALMQIPTGIMLDRFGPRRTVTGLFLLAVVGTALFTVAESGALMVLARTLMGIGCAAVFAASFMIIGRFYCARKFTSVAGALNSFAMLGTLAATLPLATLVVAYGWRASFAGILLLMGGVTLLALFNIKDSPKDTSQLTSVRPKESFRELIAGLWAVMRTRGVIPIACAGVALSAGNTILGIWGGPYLNDVHGLTEIGRGKTLSAMAVAGVAGHFVCGYLARWLDTLKGIVMGGGLAIFIITALLATMSSPSLATVTGLFAGLGFACSFPSILLTQARLLVPDYQAGRGLTVVNTGIMVAIAAMQLAVGGVMSLTSVASDSGQLVATADSYRAAFGFISIMTVVSLVLYARAADIRPTR
jgi:MFS family permease